MNRFADGCRAVDRFLAEAFGVGVHHEAPDNKCPGSPHALALGVCGEVGPHGPHPADEKPTYSN